MDCPGQVELFTLHDSLLSIMHEFSLRDNTANVLSKADMVEAYGELPFSLEYFTEVCCSLL